VEAPVRLRSPWFESPWFESELADRRLSPAVAANARRLREDGFFVVERLVPTDLAERIRAEVAEALVGQDRVQDAWQFSPAVRELALLPSVLEQLGDIYGRRPVPFQTLNFEFGTQQRHHSDLVHFNSLPSRFMCGVWVALEDVDEANGPLFYYPGSQRLPDPFFQHLGLRPSLASYHDYEIVQRALVEAAGLQPVQLHARAGDALVWAANLVHGGSPVLSPGRTRWSQVTHYFFADCVYVSPMHSDPDIGEWQVRDQLVDIATGELAPQTLDGDAVHFEPVDAVRSRIRRGPPSADAPERRLQRAEQALADSSAAVDRLLHEVHQVRSSTSFRIGNAVVRPLSAVRAHLSRRRRPPPPR
jgi:ectoine hydroxylase-related dioxygenase (phytanoyl-CoA dioxygenase family)